MPAAIAHFLFAQRVLAEANLPVESQHAFYWGAQGPDVLFAHRAMPCQHGERIAHYALRLHGCRPTPLLAWMRDRYRKHPDPALLAYAYGWICHYALDLRFHPFVRWAMERLHAQEPSQRRRTCFWEEETALDTVLLRYVSGQLPTAFRLTQVAPRDEGVQRLVASLLAGLLDDQFNAQAGKAQCRQAVQDFRLLLRMLDDRIGLKSMFLRRRERHGDRRLSCHFHGISEGGAFDYANIACMPWRSGKTGGEESAIALYEQAVPLTVAWIHEFLKAKDMNGLFGRLNFWGREESL